MVDYSFQEPAIQDAVEFLNSAPAGSCRLYSSPTGSGKTSMQVRVLKQVPDLVQLVPTPEIAEQFAHRITGDDSIYGYSKARRQEICESNRIYTYQRLCNLLSDCKIDLPTKLQYDEAHHSVSERESLVYNYTGRVIRTGWTATPYRGTPKETKKLSDDWGGECTQVLSLKQAVDKGVIAHPKWHIWPLINDELIDLTAGDFNVKSVENIVQDKLEQLVLQTFTLPKRPTMVTLTSDKLCDQFVASAKHHGYSATKVVSGTPNRRKIFDEVLACDTILVQIKVVGEGVDLPLRRLIDAAPTMSPVFWQQRLGRITRPTDGEPPEYYACCQNLTRHGYLWYGVMPPSVIKESQNAFGNPVSKRDTLRGVADLAGFGRFAPAPIPMGGGVTGALYCLQSPDGVDKLGVLIHPLCPEPLYCRRKDLGTYGKWERIEELPDVSGWVSVHNNKLTEKQQAHWARTAKYKGLDESAVITNKSYQALHMLLDTGISMRVPNE